MEYAEPLMIGYFDYAILTVLAILNIIFWKKQVRFRTGCLLSLLLFGGLLPLISIGVEIDRITQRKEVVDNFELLYTFMRFPFYWSIAVIQLFVSGQKKHSN